MSETISPHPAISPLPYNSTPSASRPTGYMPIRLALLIFAAALALHASPVPVLQRQGALHGFLLLYDSNGKQIAAGEQYNIVHGREIHTRLVFRFYDGSLDDDTAVYRQGRVIHLIRDHHIQKGPSYPHPLDVTIDVPAGRVTWIADSGKAPQQKSQRLRLPNDLINGIFWLVTENFPPNAGQVENSYLVVGSKPRIVKMTFTPDGADNAKLGATARKADRFKIHIDLGELAGVVAPAVGQQPPDLQMWTSDGPAPVFLRMTGPLYEKGPAWTILFTAPAWPEEKP
jgi:hypothetical protein